jgi:hypothetical protein
VVHAGDVLAMQAVQFPPLNVAFGLLDLSVNAPHAQ